MYGRPRAHPTLGSFTRKHCPTPLEGPLTPTAPLPFWEKLVLTRDAVRYGDLLGSLSGSGRVAPLTLEGRTPTIFALHGYCGAPQEVELACEIAAELGLRAEAPLLPGHGTHPKALSKLRFEDLLAGTLQEFHRARQRGPVVLLGMSMGSLLATELALRAPGDVAGIVFVANAFWLNRPFPGALLDLVAALRAPDFGAPKWATDLGDPETAKTHVSYRIQPTQTAISVQKAGQRLADELFRVHCPSLILHGARDQVCPVENAWKVAERLGTRDARVVVFPRSRHILLRDVERELVRRELRTFFQRCASAVTP